METKMFRTPNAIEFAFEIQKQVKDGWEVMDDPYPFFDFQQFEVHFKREAVVDEKQQEPLRKGRPAKNLTEGKE